MRSRIRAIGGAFLALTVLLPSASFPQSGGSPGKVGPENRLFHRFVQDAAIVPSFWLEGQAWLTTNNAAFDPDTRGAGEANFLQAGPVFALNVAEDFEFGARLFFANRDPERGGSETGLTDMDLWGKISIATDPMKVSLGILLSLPTGDEDKFLGSGETDVEFFAGVRKDFEHLSVAGNAGFRINQDPDFGDVSIEGRNSYLVGAAVLFPAGDRIVLSAEWALETERYEGRKNDSRLLGGLDYALGDGVRVRGAAGGALSDGGPDFIATASFVWLF